jgi:hypothetical protein
MQAMFEDDNAEAEATPESSITAPKGHESSSEVNNLIEKQYNDQVCCQTYCLMLKKQRSGFKVFGLLL